MPVKTLWAALVAACLATTAMAEPSVGFGSKTEADESASSKMAREKSLGIDKSTGGKSSRTQSSESSRERGAEASRTSRVAQDQKRGRDFTRKLGINSLLIREFIELFESGEPVMPAGNAYDTVDLFIACRPFTGMQSQFPVFLPSTNIRPGTNPADLWGKGQYSFAPTDTTLGVAQIVRKQDALADGSGTRNILHATGTVAPTITNIQGGWIQWYAACRIAAHYWLTEVAERVLDSVDGATATREDIEAAIREKITLATLDRVLWVKTIQRTQRVTNRMRSCAPFLGYPKDIQGHDMDCGVFQVENRTVYVDGIPTLSRDALNGQSYELTYSVGVDRTQGEEVSDRTYASRKASSTSASSRETYAENKNTVGLKSSKTTERSGSSKVGRDSSSQISATPGQ
jgi:hypothetical protein